MRGCENRPRTEANTQYMDSNYHQDRMRTFEGGNKGRIEKIT